MWAVAADSPKLIEKDGQWLLRWKEVHRDIAQNVGLVGQSLVIGRSVGDGAITEAEAWSLADELVISKLRVMTLPPPSADDLRINMEAMLKLSDDAAEWPAIMQNVFHLPITMVSHVQAALKARRWIQAHNPVNAVRRQAQRRAASEAASGPSI